MARDATRNLLMVGDGPAQVRQVSVAAARASWRTTVAGDAAAALAILARDGHRIEAALVDCQASSLSCPGTVEALQEAAPQLPVLLLAASATVSGVVEAMRVGAADFLVQPLTGKRLAEALDAAIERRAGGELRPLTEKIGYSLGFDEIVGSAPDFRAALAIAAKAARARTPLLIEGESGVGKEAIARAVHAASQRAHKPFVVVDCTAVAANVIESELFGHEKGAFTGAFERRAGSFQEADGGTLLLDEVNALPLAVQERVLHFLHTGEVQPLGARGMVQCDVRIIAATSHPLPDDVATARFREDLYRLLTTVHVTVPPLRRRLGDVPALSRHLLTRIALQPGMRPLGLTEDALHVLMGYNWPGNVRQLQSTLFRAAVLCEGDALTATDFPQIARATPAIGRLPDVIGGAAGVTLFEANGHLRTLEAIEADVIRLAIGHYRGRMTEVARRLGIGRSTLYRKLGELGIDNAAA